MLRLISATDKIKMQIGVSNKPCQKKLVLTLFKLPCNIKYINKLELCVEHRQLQDTCHLRIVHILFSVDLRRLNLYVVILWHLNKYLIIAYRMVSGTTEVVPPNGLVWRTY